MEGDLTMNAPHDTRNNFPAAVEPSSRADGEAAGGDSLSENA